MEVAYARLCLPWLAATALTFGEVGLGDFTTERLADPALHALAGRIGVVEDGGGDPAAFTPLVAVAWTRAGETIEVRIETMLGSPSNPLSCSSSTWTRPGGVWPTPAARGRRPRSGTPWRRWMSAMTPARP